ncbi:hypothetical protein SARC_05671, partial [Sphaeroforma arctica JP610]
MQWSIRHPNSGCLVAACRFRVLGFGVANVSMIAVVGAHKCSTPDWPIDMPTFIRAPTPMPTLFGYLHSCLSFLGTNTYACLIWVPTLMPALFEYLHLCLSYLGTYTYACLNRVPTLLPPKAVHLF